MDFRRGLCSHSMRRFLTQNIIFLRFALLFGFVFLQTTASNASGLQRLHAVYRINFSGFDLGTFQFWSEMSSKRYSVLGKGKLTVLNGFFFEWSAETRSSGKITPVGPEPKNYLFEYSSNKKKEKLKLEFQDNVVSAIIANPPYQLANDQVPISRDDLTSVFDPMSALIHLTSLTSKKITQNMSSGEIACAVNLPVFDGKERYNLVFSHKKTVRMQRTTEKGYSGPAYICRVNYIPISGHKPANKGTKFMAESKDIEVWMIPMKKVDLYVPYHIVVPTPVGHASATSQVFKVEKAGDLIAFVN